MPKSKFHNNFSDVYGPVTISGSITLPGEWQPGYLGNDAFISLCPSEFNLNGYSASPSLQTVFTELISTLNNGASAIMPSMAPTGGTGEPSLSAIKIIPKGFKATSAVVHGTGGPAAQWQAHSSNLDIGTATALTDVPPTAPGVGDTAIFTSEVMGDGSNYIILKWRPRTGGIGVLASQLYGAQIFITPI